MQLTIEPHALAEAVTGAGRLVPAKPYTPILGGLLIEATESSILLSAYDFDASITVTALATVTHPGRALVSGRLLAAVAKVLPRKPITVETGEHTLIVAGGGSRFGLPLMRVEDYPALPVAAAMSGSIEARVLAEAVKHAASAASEDDNPTNVNLTGIHIHADGNRIALASTNHFQLSAEFVDWAPDDPATGFGTLVPAVPLLDMVKTLTGQTDPVRISIGDAGFALTTPTVTTTLRAIDAGFPDWRRVIPADYQAMAAIDSAELLAALKRASIAAGKAQHVRLDVTGEGARIHVSDTEIGSADERLPAELIGADIAVRVNIDYLSTAIATMAAPVVTLGFIPGARPLVVHPGSLIDTKTPVSAFPAPDTDYRHLVMPVRG